MISFGKYRTAIDTILAVFMLTIYQSAAAHGIAYKSTGHHGEVLFSQLPPIDRHFEPVSVYYLHSSSLRPLSLQPSSDHADACRYLVINLQTLQSGGDIYEIDSQGNRRALSVDDIQTKITTISTAIDEHCHD